MTEIFSSSGRLGAYLHHSVVGHHLIGESGEECQLRYERIQLLSFLPATPICLLGTRDQHRLLKVVYDDAVLIPGCRTRAKTETLHWVDLFIQLFTRVILFTRPPKPRGMPWSCRN